MKQSMLLKKLPTAGAEIYEKVEDEARSGNPHSKLSLFKKNGMVIVIVDDDPKVGIGFTTNEMGRPVAPDNVSFNASGEPVTPAEVKLDGLTVSGMIQISIETTVEEKKVAATCTPADFAADIAAACARIKDANYPAFAQEFVAHACACGIHAEIIRAVLAYHQDAPESAFGPKPHPAYVPVDDGERVNHLEQAIMSVLLGKAVVFVGGMSTGKTVCTKTIAWMMGLRYASLQFGKTADQQELKGSQGTDNSAADQLSVELCLKAMVDAKAKALVNFLTAQCASVHIKYIRSVLTQFITEGGLCNIDEANMMDDNTMSCLNQLLDTLGTWSLPTETVRKHGRFILTMTMNPPSYSGTSVGNNATWSRICFENFGTVKDVSKALEAGMRPLVVNGLSDDEKSELQKTVKTVNKIYIALYKLWEQKQITDRVLNIRGFVSALEEYAQFGIKGHMRVSSLRSAIMKYCVNSVRVYEPRDAVTIATTIDMYL